jgi:hypothetical protein
MQGFSRPFWFTVLAGALSAALFCYGLLSYLDAHIQEMITLCTAQNFTCSNESIESAFHVFLLTDMAGILLVFWLAYRIGLRFIKPAPQAVTDAAR